MSPPARIFVSYSTVDEPAYRQLCKFLGGPAMKSRLMLLGCHESSLAVLSAAERQHHLKATDYLIVLLSADYCGDAGCLADLSLLQSFGHVVHLPIRLRPFPIQLLPPLLADRQSLPRGQRTLSDSSDVDAAWTEVVQEIICLLDGRQARTPFASSQLNRIQPGQTVAGRYQIESEIDSGGMATVYRALDLQRQAPVAIKILHPWLFHETPQHRQFEREATLLKQLQHPNTVRASDFATDKALSIVYIVLELLEGQTLADYIQTNGRICLSDLILIYSQIVGALQEAHNKDIIHRDIKPENIILVGQGKLAQRQCKLIDFGIAKSPSALDPRNTVPLVSQRFMAPEQASLNTPITVATDIWALGLLAFFLLTGRHYFDAADRRQPEQAAILREIWNPERTHAKERAAAVGCTNCLPDGFHTWLMRCIAIDPEKRFRSIAEAFADLCCLPRPDATAAPATASPSPPPMPASTRQEALPTISQPSRLFPLYGVYLGLTHTDKLKQLGVRSKFWDVWPLWRYQCYEINDIDFWYNSQNIVDHVYLTRSKKMPDPWKQLGLTWDLSFIVAKQIIISLGFTIINAIIESQRPNGLQWASITARREYDTILGVELSFVGDRGFSAETPGTLYSISFTVCPDR